MYSLVMMMAVNGGAAEAPQFHRRDYTPYIITNGCCGGCCGGGCCGGIPVAPAAAGCFYNTTWSSGCYTPTNWSEGCAITAPSALSMPGGCAGSFPAIPAAPVAPKTALPAAPAPAPAPATTPAPAPNSDQPKAMPKKPLTEAVPVPNLLRSDVTLRMPAGAVLYVNGAPAALPGPDGRFETPALPPGVEFAYVFKAVTEEDGVLREASKRVTFRAGEAVVIDLRDPRLARNDGGR